MAIVVNLIGEGLFVLVDDRTAELGGSFYYSPLRPYSPLPLKWCWEQLSRYPKATLIDVGAHTGCYTLLAKHHPDLTVHAFEPVELTARVLQENINLNELQDKVTVYQMGVSNYNGEGILHSVKALGGSGVSMIDGKPAWHKDCIDSPIPVITIDTFCELNDIAPTFIKIDTEGADLRVLRGAKKTIEKYHPFILCEYSQENADQYGIAVSDIVAFVEKYGYVWTNPEGTDLWCVAKGWENNGELERSLDTDSSAATG